MTFAPGWVQIIDPANERRDLLTFINDTHKAVYGYRPRWDREWADNVPMADLRKEARNLEESVVAEAAAQRARELRRQAEMAVHHLAVSKAKKPLPYTFKPFANLREMI